jgi:hypothetical protein
MSSYGLWFLFSSLLGLHSFASPRLHGLWVAQGRHSIAWLSREDNLLRFKRGLAGLDWVYVTSFPLSGRSGIWATVLSRILGHYYLIASHDGIAASIHRVYLGVPAIGHQHVCICYSEIECIEFIIISFSSRPVSMITTMRAGTAASDHRGPRLVMSTTVKLGYNHLYFQLTYVTTAKRRVIACSSI